MASLPQTLVAFRAQDGYRRWSRRTDGPLFVLALLFLSLLVVPRLWNVPPWLGTTLAGVNFTIWLAFAVDYFSRLYLSGNRLHYVRTHLLDLLIVALPMLRPLRVFRVIRFASVAAIAAKRGESSLHGRMTAYATTTAVVSLILAGVLIHDIEGNSSDGNIRSVWDGIWWAAATITTVGYGDHYPTTTAGRSIAVALMLVGIAIIGVITAAIAAWFVDRLRDDPDDSETADSRTTATLDQLLLEVRSLREEVRQLRNSAG